MARRPSTGNLQQSAAAAALRASGHTPIPVGETETKRTLQRQSSFGSFPSDRKGLVRRSSSASMSERSFRTTSPNRPTHGSGVDDVPPVPAIPKNFDDNRQHRRAASMEPIKRPKSPLPAKGNRVESVDRKFNYNPNSRIRERPGSSLGKEYGRSNGQVLNENTPRTARRGQSPSGNSLQQPKMSPDIIATGPVSDRMHKQRKKRTDPNDLKSDKFSPVNDTASLSESADSPRLRGKDVRADLDVQEQQPKKAKIKNRRENARNPEAVDHTMPGYSRSLDQDGQSPASKRGLRAHGSLFKQPSTVREDWEGEQMHAPRSLTEKTHASTVGSNKMPSVASRATSQITPSLHLSQTLGKKSSSPQSTSSLGSEEREEATERTRSISSYDLDRRSRQASLSPSRSTRFSAKIASELSAWPRHEPPGRAVSPAKSALKQHIPSPRAASPNGLTTSTKWKDGSQASSNATEDTTPISGGETGGRSQLRKSLRVSFEEDSESRNSPDGDNIDELKLVDTRSNRPLPLMRACERDETEHDLGSDSDEEVLDRFLKDRPILPSFGSVRPQREIVTDQDVNDQSAGGVNHSSFLSSPPASAKVHTASTVHGKVETIADGDLLIGQRDTAEFPAGSSTSPTSASDSGRKAERTNEVELNDLPEDNKTLSLPTISVQPATPALESNSNFGFAEMPGSFPDSDAQTMFQSDGPGNGSRLVMSTQGDTFMADVVSSATACPSDENGLQRESTNKKTFQLVHDERDSESAASSVYSDAAEDANELGFEGFRSLNAVVESPVGSAPTPKTVTSHSNPVALMDDGLGFSHESPRSRFTQDHGRPVEGIGSLTDKSPRKKKQRQKARGLPHELTNGGPDSNLSPRLLPTTASSKGQDDGGMPETAGQDTRHSGMVSRKGNVFSKSPQKSAEGGRIGLPGSRVAPTDHSDDGQLQVSSTTPVSSQPKTTEEVSARARTIALAMSLNRKGSVDSDSSSSFKKSRGAQTPNSGPTMRKSMRGNPAERIHSGSTRARDVRSSSPPRRRAFSSRGEDGVGPTLRGSASHAVPSLRSPASHGPTSILSGYRKSRPKEKEPRADSPSFRFKSRFADSDSDDEQVIPKQHHRGKKAKDSDVTKSRPPVRGIPRRLNGDDSTELDDSSDEERVRSMHQKKQSPPKAARSWSNLPTHSQDNILSTQNGRLPSPTSTKKKGIFGRFRRRESEIRNATQEPSGESSTQHKPVPEPQANSPASITLPDSKSKLQRRSAPHRTISDSWPLSEAQPTSQARPSTASPVTVSNRQKSGSAVGQEPDSTRASSSLQTFGIADRHEKKKRFPFLRRAFGRS